MQQAKFPYLTFALYVLGFLLFWEWLRPLSIITDTNHVEFFISFAAFSIFLSYLRFPVWITFPAKLLAMMYALHTLFFYNSSFFDPLWIEFLIQDTQKNIDFLIHGNWVGLTNLFRSLLFFILLWVISYLMHYWLIQARKLFLFFFVTIIYLTVLDTFTMYSAEAAIVRTMIIGLVLLGLLRMLKVQEKEKVSFDRGRMPFPWIAALLAMILLTSTLGFAAPKIGPQWPDPVPFIKRAANGYSDNGSGTGGVKTIGYDSNDKRLGGPFLMDKTPVFRTFVEDPHYWRVESKRVYTGKGWVSRKQESKIHVNNNQLQNYSALNMYTDDVKTTTHVDQVINLVEEFPHIAYSGEVLELTGISDDDLWLTPTKGKLQLIENGQVVTEKDYSVKYREPSFKVKELKTVKNETVSPEMEKYLQLPETLPEKVKNLTVKITKNADNRYEKAMAIVNFFKYNDYRYSTQNVPYPEEGQDYVAQFLFQTQRGYCDNFSTSMAVMLRTIDIPTRWVKGFTFGEYVGRENGKDEYLVRNSNAHSWVEVYFPGYGWVPFEPTKSFNPLFNFVEETDNNAEQASTTPAPSKPKKPEQDKSQQEQGSSDKESAGWFSIWMQDMIDKYGKWLLSVPTAVAALVVYWLFKSRRKWFPLLVIRKFRNRHDEKAFDRALRQLLQVLEMYGYRKETSKTLREFAVEVDRSLGISDMKKLTKAYEQSRYTNKKVNQWAESKETWERIIRHLRA